MPEPVQRTRRYMPGLDRLRAIAVMGVLLYHLGFAWIPGGLLGVGVFFTLSGYLITDLLLAQADRGGIKLKSFWLARARRLLPALILMLLVVTAWVTLIGPRQAPDYNDSALSALLYVNNWWLIFHDVSYFAQFTTPPPLNHLWSLSVEEQFYILWPFMLLGGLRLVREGDLYRGLRFRLAGITLGLALASGVLMIVLHHPGLDPSRVYYGTDTRALELLVGAALAMVWPSRRLRRDVSEGARNALDALGVAGLVGIGLMFWRSTEFSTFLYNGGFLVLSVVTAAALIALTHPAARLGAIVGWGAMRWIGERSYGIYLWHFPIVVLSTPEGAEGLDLARAALQLAATFAVAALSWKFVEDPIRHGALGRLIARARAGERPSRRAIPAYGWALGLGATVVLAAALAGLAGVGDDASKATTVGEINVAKTVTAQSAARRRDRAVCRSVVHIGDSTSEGLDSPEYLPDPGDRISAQYARVGVTTQHLEISGARSIFETFNGIPNAYDVAAVWVDRGFGGCWVLALGTNETANVAAGSNYDLEQRVDRMMSVVGDQPVLWVNVRSLVADGGPYDNTNMLLWNNALREACDRYPNMRVYDWAADVKDDWFVEDGVHFTEQGYTVRSSQIAEALRDAFPAGPGAAAAALGGPGQGACVVRPPREVPARPQSEPRAASVSG